jgi:hypothetical protein
MPWVFFFYWSFIIVSHHAVSAKFGRRPFLRAYFTFS